MGTINFDDDVLDTPAELFAVLSQLADRGWVGSVGVGATSPAADAPLVWKLDAHTALPTAVDGTLGTDGVRRVIATLGDHKITIGSTITVMTPEVYAASYGA